MNYLIVLIVVLIVLTTAATANAGPKMDLALDISTAVWRPSCVLQYRFVDFKGGPYPDALGYSNSTDCSIWINTARQDKSWNTFCSTVLHEAGHLAGQDHSSNPRSVMFPFFSGKGDRRCTKFKMDKS